MQVERKVWEKVKEKVTKTVAVATLLLAVSVGSPPAQAAVSESLTTTISGGRFVTTNAKLSSNGLLLATTRVWTTNAMVGYTANIAVACEDARGDTIAISDGHSWGVDGVGIFWKPSDRTMVWNQVFSPDVAARTTKLTILHTYQGRDRWNDIVRDIQNGIRDVGRVIGEVKALAGTLQWLRPVPGATLPTLPVQPTQPVQPVQPTQPVQPVQPTQPVQPVQPTQPAQPTGPRYHGAIDYVDAFVVRGWAQDTVLPNAVLKVHLFVDDVRVTTVLANLQRPDLIAVGKGHGRYGFEAQIAAVFRDGRPHRVKALYENDADRLPGRSGWLLSSGVRLGF